MENPKPQGESSAAKDIVVIVIILLVLAGAIGGLAYGIFRVVRSASKSDAQKAVVAKKPTVTVAAPSAARAPQPSAKIPTPRQLPAVPTPAAVPAVAPAASVLELGRDDAAVRAIADIQVSGFDLKQAKVTLNKARTATQIRIPVGLRLTPKTTTNLCAYVVTESGTIGVSPGGAEAVVYVPVAGTDFHYLHAPVNGVEFQWAAPDGRDPVVAFLTFAAARTSSWNTAQTGVWVLKNNISRQELAAFRLGYADASAPGGVRQEPLALYTDVKNVEAMLSALGRDPDACRLIVEEREERNRLVNQVNFEKPLSGSLSILRNKSLARYTGDSEVERILRQYLSQHKRYDVRRAALENLLAVGLIGSPDAIFQKMVWDNDFNLRLVAAATLVRSGDARGLPILAACADDPIAGDLCVATAEAAIQKKSGLSRNAEEGLLAYWTRAIGWDGAGFKAGEVESLKRAIAGVLPAADAALTQALADVVSADDAKASAACHAMARYPRSPKAFDALCRTALQPRTVDVRFNAINTLRSFRDWSPSKMCEQIIKQDEERLVYAVLNLISASQFNGFEKCLLLATKHSSPAIRREAADILGHAGVADAERDLAKMAQYDADGGVKDAALYALSVLRSMEGLSLCQSLLRSGERNNKFRAWRCLQVWEGDPSALELLQKYKTDPDVGRDITAHLARYAK